MNRYAILAAVALTIGTSAAFCQQPSEPPGAVKSGGETVPLQPLPAEALAVPEWSEQFPRVWVRGEYVLWAIGTGKLVDLGKETYNSDTFNGLLNAAGKSYGDFVSRLLGDDRTGMRFSAGAWMDQEETVGVEANFTYLERSPLVLPLINRNPSPLGSMLLSRIGLPAIDPNGRQVVIPFVPSAPAGRVTVEIADQELWILDLIGRDRFYETENFSIDGLAGYRRVFYRDSFTVRSDTVQHSPLLQAGTQVTSVDQITTENGYDGGLVGVELAAKYGSWSLTARPTATIAYLHADVFRGGYTMANNPNLPQVQNYGGTYLRPEDIGTFTSHQWTVIPELTLQLTHSIGEHVRLSVGTSLMYLPVAARAADQIELGLDSDRVLPGTTGTQVGRNLVVPNLKSVFLNTYTVGLELRY
jgi:Putative beta barrel porin-7 (BBP7)